ncbi:MAG: UDP-glucose 4-epimerase GalE [Cytophagaceae bacterium]|nr:UDP-glucose 4-epimerase GalE [Cytophagaceae bacterium]MDW8456471.1 UDP-glucose 4-epimerase GalE [Cytophagaceae bacterium]
MAILVTGGAGFIGSHAVRDLVKNGFKVVVIDNMIYGHKEAIVDSEVTLVEGDIGDKNLLKNIFTQHKIEGVIHFAAYAYVGESVKEPLKYYKNNVASSLTLLETMLENDCKKIIFSSTCATYGNPVQIPITESHPQSPINPYGWSKLMLEKIIMDFHRAYGFEYVFLRYFNASGSSKEGIIGEDHEPETHLIPLVLRSLLPGEPPITVFGTDYDTPDGTCIRDYIHVEDLASAHVKALSYILNGNPSIALNLGVGRGYSVKEIIQAAEAVTGLKVNLKYGERRAGDPPILVADNTLAKKTLDWQPVYNDINEIIATAWKWFNSSHGGRYGMKK